MSHDDADDRFDELPLRVRARLRREEHWYWTGALTYSRIDSGGYGQLSTRQNGQRRRVRVHRFVYETLVGPIPDGLVIDHLCGVHLCCRPSHLEAVTLAENGRRGRPGVVINTHRPGEWVAASPFVEWEQLVLFGET